MYTHFLFSAVKIEKKRHNGLKECLTTFNPTWTLVLIKKKVKKFQKKILLFSLSVLWLSQTGWDRMSKSRPIPSSGKMSKFRPIQVCPMAKCQNPVPAHPGLSCKKILTLSGCPYVLGQ